MSDYIRKSDALEIIRRNGIDNIFAGIPLETSKIYKELEELKPVETLEDVLKRLRKMPGSFVLNFDTFGSEEGNDLSKEWVCRYWPTIHEVEDYNSPTNGFGNTPLEAALALEAKLNNQP